MTKEQIGSVLKELRISCGLTQKEAAEKLGKKQQTIASWEIGQSQPDANTLFFICSIYGTTVDEAFGFTKNTNNFSPEDILLIKKYHSLDERGRNIVDIVLDKEHSYSKAEKEKEQTQPVPVSIAPETEPEHLMVNAAHEIEGATEEEKARVDAMMDDDSLWERKF